ncbi:MAG: peptide chain release factor N(5)-glutamine methyltransferase [Bacteroidia bacterium]|nr:MAG: peptide chain release factor N(5)-glutamine methyltransferase [Bacteroidia bacterium]
MLQNRATLKQTRFSLLNELRQDYSENESESITRLILEHAGFPLSVCLLEPDKITPSSIIAQINTIVDEIQSGRPIQYVLGQTQFCSIKVVVDERVLIPRPETEEMVYMIQSGDRQKFSRIIDLGTGSGSIALALKHHFPEAMVAGLDVSTEALALANQNGRLNDLEVLWVEGDLLNTSVLPEQGELDKGFDLVVSNPPYVLESEKKQMEDHVLQHEPGKALFVKDEDPLLYYRAILRFCDIHLDAGGQLWVEINERFGNETATLFENAGYQHVRIQKDIHEKERFIDARK